MKEIFKEITIHETKILVSNFGRIIRSNKELNQVENHDGYYQVHIKNNKTSGVHRLVALAFIENDSPNVKVEVNHKDFNRKNNAVENLEWLSHSDNIKYSRENGRYPSSFGKDNPNYGNKKLSTFYKENPDIALLKQSRKGVRNGKATPIKVFKEGLLIGDFTYIGECCDFLHNNYGFSSNFETIRCGIRKSIELNRPYKGLTFIK